MQKIKFSEITNLDNKKPGIYEIYTNEHIPLKVGISTNIKRRLREHKNSKQKYLKIKNHNLSISPNNIKSNQSILAKHLYFDTKIAPSFDLTKEEDRKIFLEEHCYIKFKYTTTKQDARKIEIEKEKEDFRYIGKVKNR